jgi:uncharacterized membrane protein YGL010W
MQALSDQMAFYESYHTSFGCKLTHWFGIPLVTFAILIPMGWLGFSVSGHRLTLATAFVVGTLGYYFLLDRVLALLMVVCIAPIAWAASWAASRAFPETRWIFAAAFTGGWILQILGHVIEGKRPALLDNFTQAVFTAPLFLLAEAVSGLGWKPREKTAARR